MYGIDWYLIDIYIITQKFKLIKLMKIKELKIF